MIPMPLSQDKRFEMFVRDPLSEADIAAVTLAATYKALYPAANFPVLDANYFNRVGKRMRIRAFGKITTAATPGNLQLALFYGTGADANGVNLVASAAQTLIAAQTNLAWEAEFHVQCRSIGAAGTLFARGYAMFNPAVIAVNSFMIPASAPVVSAACDLTAANILSVQALRSGSTVETMTVQDLEVTQIG
jgi:hypothetical protein